MWNNLLSWGCRRKYIECLRKVTPNIYKRIYNTFVAVIMIKAFGRFHCWCYNKLCDFVIWMVGIIQLLLEKLDPWPSGCREPSCLYNITWIINIIPLLKYYNNTLTNYILTRSHWRKVRWHQKLQITSANEFNFSIVLARD